MVGINDVFWVRSSVVNFSAHMTHECDTATLKIGLRTLLRHVGKDQGDAVFRPLYFCYLSFRQA
ncbi:MAG: hypothetical protein QM579_08880 [Desulfovibrio sp.]|uniref:hypothetical protein n=1 Tax=Desulfovibrio sp. TaxID=885 RepID=UPI0039E2D091